MTLRMPGVSYIGPPDSNWGGSIVRPPMGMVVHIAEGSFQGTISWQRNPDADVSSYFVVSKLGEIVQMLDLDLMAWTQAAGNPTWIGVENEGFATGQFTPAQTTANARIFAWLVGLYPTIPYQVSNSPSTKGCGWHGMGGAAWGGHYGCPGTNNVALLPSIVAQAQQINGGGPTPPPSTPKRGWRNVIPYVVQDDSVGIALAWAEASVGKWVYTNILPPANKSTVSVPAFVSQLATLGCVTNAGNTFAVTLSNSAYVELSKAPGVIPPPVIGDVIAKIPDLTVNLTTTGTLNTED